LHGGDDLRFRERLGYIEITAEPDILRDGAEEFIRRCQPDRFEHFFPLFGRVWYIAHKISPGGPGSPGSQKGSTISGLSPCSDSQPYSWLERYSSYSSPERRPSASPGLSIFSFTIQPSP